MRRARLPLILIMLAIAANARADVVRILDDDREAFQARVDILQQATVEIDAVYFLARNDRITLTALALLREARRRGVTTRLIVDAPFLHISHPVLAHLRDEGVEVRVYHPLTLCHPTWIFRRMHEKFIVVDNGQYITGGRNLAAAYFGLAKRNFIDRDVYVEGPSAIEADDHFEQLWSSPDVASLRVRVGAGKKDRAARQLDGLLAGLRAGGGFVNLDTQHDWAAGQRTASSVHFLHDPVTAGQGPRVGDRLAALLAAATSSIVIESPYVVPSLEQRLLLEKKGDEGVGVRIVTNSLRSTDGVLTYVAYLKYRRRLLKSGIDIREYKGPDTLHAKSIVIDDRIMLIGSWNLDPRSKNLNAESMCIAEDGELARQLLAAIAVHEQNSWKVRANFHRVRTFRIWLMHLVAFFIEGQL